MMTSYTIMIIRVAQPTLLTITYVFFEGRATKRMTVHHSTSTLLNHTYSTTTLVMKISATPSYLF